MINNNQVSIKQLTLSVALSSTIYASVNNIPLEKIVFALKEVLQRWRDHIPYMQNIDVYLGKTIISWLPVKNNYQKAWRLLQNIPRTGIMYSWYMHWSEIIQEAKKDLTTLFLEQQLPENIGEETTYAMLWIALSVLIYRLLTKWWDLQEYKALLTKNNHFWDNQDVSLQPRDKQP